DPCDAPHEHLRRSDKASAVRRRSTSDVRITRAAAASASCSSGSSVAPTVSVAPVNGDATLAVDVKVVSSRPVNPRFAVASALDSVFLPAAWWATVRTAYLLEAYSAPQHRFEQGAQSSPARARSIRRVGISRRDRAKAAEAFRRLVR